MTVSTGRPVEAEFNNGNEAPHALCGARPLTYVEQGVAHFLLCRSVREYE